MIKISAAYCSYNPNFVIQNLDEPKKWESPIFAIFKNLVMRGCPTIPSVFLREKFGLPQTGDFNYNIDFDNLNWDSVIKGGMLENPALDFYYNILPEVFPLAGSFLPECPISDILVSDKRLSGEVDFYSPVYKLVIEIDGSQHTSGEQLQKDVLRDSTFANQNVDLIRIPTSMLKDKNKVVELLRNKASKKLKYRENSSFISKNDKQYMLAIRLQSLFLYLYGTSKLLPNQNQLNLNLKTDFEIDEESIQIILEDFYTWMRVLANLNKVTFEKPSIDIKIYNDLEEFLASEGVKVDISLTKAYSIIQNLDIFYIRNDYFEYSTFARERKNKQIEYFAGKNYFKVANAEVKYDLDKQRDGPDLKYILQNVSNEEYSDFRANQLDIIIEALNKRCVIGVLPTGAGKSLCYQISALLIPSMTIVVAPLKLLMVDQYEHLCKNLGINHSTYINSTHTEHLEFFTKGQSLITLLAPERFFSEKFVKTLMEKEINNIKVGFVVIDEAHCLSEWGHDFRTSYLCLSHNLARFLPKQTVLMALTGTASHSVFRDIENEFYYFKNKHTNSIFADDMRRTNLDITVKKFVDHVGDNYDIFQAVTENIFPTLRGINKKKTLVFTKTKNSGKSEKFQYASACIPLCKKFKEMCKDEDDGVVGYFAGGDELDDDEREKLLEDFKNDTPLKVLFATKAFGMGIDIKDIRKTIHYGLPSSMESLYQQIGRAGRDGKQSDCYIYFVEEEEEVYNYFFSNRGITVANIESKQGKLKELNTNFFFIQNANLDVITEIDVTKRIYEGVCRLNARGVYSADCNTIAQALYKSIRDPHLKRILGLVIDDELRITANTSTIIEKALYRLFLLGEIDMWTVVYGSDVVNPMYGNLKLTSYTEEGKRERLVSHIERYESRARAMPEENTFETRLKKLVEWSYDNFFLERIKSMKTLYDWCMDFTDSNNFMSRLSDYFSSDPVYMRLTDDRSILDWIDAIKRKPEETKLRIARLLESYENIDGLNYVSGITRLKLGEFNSFDGERRLDMSFVGIKEFSDADRTKLLVATYRCLDTEETKDIFIDKWLKFIPKDVYMIYEHLKSGVAEKYILSDFVDKLMKVKEIVDVRLQ